MKRVIHLTIIVIILAPFNLSAATLYVSLASTNPVPPYATWATAATNIQDAVDAAAIGSLILVTNGVYSTGGRVVGPGLLLNRVAIEKPLILQSVNGPEFTVIRGVGVAGSGARAIRCVYLEDGATLCGFTLRDGSTLVLSGDIERDQSGGGVWCASTNATVTNCVLTANSADDYGGGAWSGTLTHCTVTGNTAGNGGGTATSTLFECALEGNKAAFHGGGALDGLLRNCTLKGNSAEYGGGVGMASWYGGCALYNCVITGNSAGRGGGVAGSTYPCVLNNCTITANSASVYGGGVASEFYGAGGGVLVNCIVYFNQPGNYEDSTFINSCTTPLPPGPGNTDADPQLVNATHLSPQSPCVGAGNPTIVLGTDIDGEPWANPPAIGADQPNPTSGKVNLSITAPIATVATEYPLSLTGDVTGAVSRSVWDFGDGTSSTNRPFASHAWTAAGQYAVTLTAYNDTYPNGVSVGTVVTVVNAPRYVDAASPHPLPPYESWATAATTLQDAVDVSTIPGTVVWVTNGVYATGSKALGFSGENRVLVTQPITLRSVNGPDVTIIRGKLPAPDGAARCAYLSEGATLSGFTLENGAALPGITDWETGGGVWCASTNVLVTNCVFRGNWAVRGGGAYGGTLKHCIFWGNSTPGQGGDDGGGVYESVVWNSRFSDNTACAGGAIARSTLHNCTIIRNSAAGGGGGAYASTLLNCTVTGNSAWGEGGGTYFCSAANSIIYFNQAASSNNFSNTRLEYSCATPLADGAGNIDSDPRLITATHLAPNSPCAGAGSSAYAAGIDIDGEPWANPPSMGAAEPSPASEAGPLMLQIEAPVRLFAPGYAAALTALSTGPIQQSVWDFGDGSMLTNQAFVRHAWSMAGTYEVRLTGYNAGIPGGISTFITVNVKAQVSYVNLASTTPRPPFENWNTAAVDIQDAVNTAIVGSTVLVSNGVYRASGVSEYYGGSSRVMLTRNVIVRSVNGPSVTFIQGDTNNTRCAFVADGSVLSGFTLTNGAASVGGGVYCEPSGIVTNCVLVGNRADTGGGASGGLLYNCALIGNVAGTGGGASGGALYQCLLKGNLSSGSGGGTEGSQLFNCSLAGNAARSGGGGANGGTLYGCVLTANTAFESGGGANGGTLYNCTVVQNSAASGGGVNASTCHNSIAWFNQAHKGPNCLDSTLDYSCATPLPPGAGNIDSDPLLVTANHLSPNSPCVGAGDHSWATGTDIDGEPWANPPAIGADQPGADGSLTVWIEAESPTVVPGLDLRFTAWSTGSPQRIVWDFGDGTMLTNEPFASHSWANPGVYLVQLTAFNTAVPGGTSASVGVTVGAATLYVDASNPEPVFPYDQWHTAAATLQAAVDAAPLGATVLVTNGVYAAGLRAAPGTENNRLVLAKRVTLRSVNGPQVTVIDGLGLARCAYVANGAVLSGFTLTNGSPGSIGGEGGGIWAEPFGIVTNCVLIGNIAFNAGGAYGGRLYNCRLEGNGSAFIGGAASSVLFNCLVISNSASGYLWSSGQGAGVSRCTLYNCVVMGNSAGYGGGAVHSALTNCIVMFNSASDSPNYDPACSLDHSCATPLAPGPGNIATDPVFAKAAAGDFHLCYGSPCIDAGIDLGDLIRADFDGRSRPLPGRDNGRPAFDIGAYEFDGNAAPVFVSSSLSSDKLTLAWSAAAQGMVLQRSPRLINANWEAIPASATTNTITLPLSGGLEFFRLVRSIAN